MDSAPVSVQEPTDSRKTARWALVLLLLMNAAVGISVLRHVAESNLDADEVEHAHVAWATSQGIMPYRDIHQIHTPLLWILSAPLVGHLPESAGSVVSLRTLCLLAFVVAYIAGLLVLREVAGPIGRDRCLTLLLLSLSVVPAFELYRFRPDPFMAACAALAILSAVRLGRAPLCYSVVGGVFLGLAAGFSTKIAPLCLLVPTICAIECWRRRSPIPFWPAITHGVGFLIGLAPTVFWLWHYDLFESFVHWTITVNAHAVNFSIVKVLNFTDGCEIVTALALIGWAAVAWMKPETLKTSWSPTTALLLAAFFALLIVLIAPNHRAYNFQIFTMPGAVLGTMLLMMLSDSGEWAWKRLAIFGAILALAAGKPVLRGVDLLAPGTTVAIVDLQKLIDLCPAQKDVCVGFAPWHPVFRRDASELYQGWDLWFLEQPDISAEGKRPYREMWPRAISDIEKRQPVLVVDQNSWLVAQKYGGLTDDEYNRFSRYMRRHYNRTKAGEISVYVRKNTMVQ